MEKEKKPVYKEWWFWFITIFLIIGIICSAGSSNTETANNITNTESNNNINITSSKREEVTVIDFSSMNKTDIQAWCNTNKIKCNITEDYSDTIKKGEFVSQSAEINSTIYQGDTIKIIYSLGKKPSTEETNALKKAQSYSSTMHMSKKGIYNQLTSSVEGFSKEAAQYAIDNINANWKDNALEKAKSYQNMMSMSKQGVYNQLISYAEGFTKEEAQYAIDHLND